MRTIRLDSRGAGLRVVLLAARWHPEVVDRLVEGARQALERSGVNPAHVVLIEVPGSYELPQAAMRVARSGKADAIVALGCVIRGETPHAEVLERAVADGLLRVAQETGVPVGFGVITAETRAQADARSDLGKTGGKGGHKGVEAAEAAVSLAASLRGWEAGR
jgi:6,7-dimethyl-8-ribityllumazine synthase